MIIREKYEIELSCKILRKTEVAFTAVDTVKNGTFEMFNSAGTLKLDLVSSIGSFFDEFKALIDKYKNEDNLKGLQNTQIPDVQQ